MFNTLTGETKRRAKDEPKSYSRPCIQLLVLGLSAKAPWCLSDCQMAPHEFTLLILLLVLHWKWKKLRVCCKIKGGNLIGNKYIFQRFIFEMEHPQPSKTWELSLYELHRTPQEAITDNTEIAVSPRSLHSELMCPICLDMLKNTMTTKECLHRYGVIFTFGITFGGAWPIVRTADVEADVECYRLSTE